MSPPPFTAATPALSVSSRRRLQFGLRSLLLLIVVCALGFAAWRQWQQHRELETWRNRAIFYRREAELRRVVSEVTRKLNLKDPEHRRIVQIVNRLSPWFGDSVIRQEIKLQGVSMEVIVFQDVDLNLEGGAESVVLLFAADRLVDYVIHNASERHEVKLEDADRDGQLDVVYHCQDGMFKNGEQFTERYSIRNDGFQRVE
jgi:hypothetical protein